MYSQNWYTGSQPQRRPPEENQRPGGWSQQPSSDVWQYNQRYQDPQAQLIAAQNQNPYQFNHHGQSGPPSANPSTDSSFSNTQGQDPVPANAQANHQEVSLVAGHSGSNETASSSYPNFLQSSDDQIESLMDSSILRAPSSYHVHPQGSFHPRQPPSQDQHRLLQFGDPVGSHASLQGQWNPHWQQQAHQPSPSFDDLSQWSGPSHSSSRDEIWQSPNLSKEHTQNGTSFALPPGFSGEGGNGNSSLSQPSSVPHEQRSMAFTSSHRSSLADAQDFNVNTLQSDSSRHTTGDSSLPWLQTSSLDGLPAPASDMAMGSAGASPSNELSPKSSQPQQRRSMKPSSLRNQMPNQYAHHSVLHGETLRFASPTDSQQEAGNGNQSRLNPLTSSAPASRNGSGSDMPPAFGPTFDQPVIYPNFDAAVLQHPSNQGFGEGQQNFRQLDRRSQDLNRSSISTSSLQHSVLGEGDRPISSRSSSSAASQPSSLISNAGTSDHLGNGLVSSSNVAREGSLSTLSGAFRPTQNCAEQPRPQPTLRFSATNPVMNHDEGVFSANEQSTMSSANTRQRASTFSSLSATPNSQISVSQNVADVGAGRPSFLRPNSSDGATPLASGGNAFQSLEESRQQQMTQPSTSYLPQVGPAMMSTRDVQMAGRSLGTSASHSQPFSGLPRSDSDPARLSAAMASTQLGSVGQAQEPHHSTPTIVEEEEEFANSQSGLSSHFATNSLHQPQQSSNASREQDFAAGFDSMDDVGNDLTRRQQHQAFMQQMEQTGPQDVRPSAYNDVGSMGKAQIQMQSHPSQANATPVVLRRRYKPALRPTTYQQLTMMSLGEDGSDQPASGLGDVGAHSGKFIDDIIRHYITCPSRLGLGERTVLIMTSKVAQKSYGAEKRFLSPPPMVLLIGSSWWNSCQDSTVSGMQGHYGNSFGAEPPTILTPPRVNIGMSGETNNQDGALEWATSSGRLIDVGNPSLEMAVSGRCIGKQLYISDLDEKRRTCEMLVSLSVPGLSATDARLLGTFASKPIKIISKPSKKRQSNRNTELGIVHGSIVSLFHRLRSQTVSTRYLCVSGAPTWFKGSDGLPFLSVDQTNAKLRPSDSPSCFVAKMTSWDPFVIYLVDPDKDPNDPNAPAMKPQAPGYPPPPPSAMAVPNPGQAQKTIHYNQRIVLQCLNTAVVSPIMVIRKVEKAATVVGGAAAPDDASSSLPGSGANTSEALGDPVSQLHKIALEVVEDLSAPAPSVVPGKSGEVDSPGAGGPFLACLNESVGMRRPPEGRKWTWSPSDAKTSSVGESPAPQSPTAFAAAYAAAQTRNSLSQTRTSLSGSSRPLSSSSTGSSSAAPYPLVSQAQQRPPSSDGGKVRRPRRVSSSIVTQRERGSTSGSSSTLAPGSSLSGGSVVPGAGAVSTSTPVATKGRRRGQSLSVVEWQREHARQQGGGALDPELVASGSHATGSISEASLGGAPLSASWSVDIADSDVWTIVGTDIARHTFYIPPRLAGGASPATDVPDSGIAHLITTPAPSAPITPIPALHSFVPPNPQDAQPCVTLFGLNFTQDLLVYFGDWRSTHVQARSPDTILCAPPPPASEAFEVPNVRLPIILVRKDGVIFPTDCIYST
ncbi:unnamed protein product [Sympodiomycopsis kandeliae]